MADSQHSTHPAISEARTAIKMLERSGMTYNADHPLVVLDRCLDSLEEQLGAARKVVDAARAVDAVRYSERPVRGLNQAVALRLALGDYDALDPATCPDCGHDAHTPRYCVIRHCACGEPDPASTDVQAQPSTTSDDREAGSMREHMHRLTGDSGTPPGGPPSAVSSPAKERP